MWREVTVMVASRYDSKVRHHATILPPPGSHRAARTAPPPPLQQSTTEVLMRAEQLAKAAIRILASADELYHSAAAMGAGNASLGHYRLVRGGVR